MTSLNQCFVFLGSLRRLTQTSDALHIAFQSFPSYFFCTPSIFHPAVSLRVQVRDTPSVDELFWFLEAITNRNGSIEQPRRFTSCSCRLDNRNGSRCGCFKGYCWGNATEEHAEPDDWWCDTQLMGITDKQSEWQQYSIDTNYSWDRICVQHKREGEEQRSICWSKCVFVDYSNISLWP